MLESSRTEVRRWRAWATGVAAGELRYRDRGGWRPVPSRRLSPAVQSARSGWGAVGGRHGRRRPRSTSPTPPTVCCSGDTTNVSNAARGPRGCRSCPTAMPSAQVPSSVARRVQRHLASRRHTLVSSDTTNRPELLGTGPSSQLTNRLPGRGGIRSGTVQSSASPGRRQQTTRAALARPGAASEYSAGSVDPRGLRRGRGPLGVYLRRRTYMQTETADGRCTARGSAGAAVRGAAFARRASQVVVLTGPPPAPAAPSGPPGQALASPVILKQPSDAPA